MSRYRMTNWQKGDLITAEKMNKIEAGINDASFKIGNGLQFNKEDGSLEIGDSINELGNEVNELSGRVTANEADIMTIQSDITDLTGNVEQIIEALKQNNIIIG